jgi:arylsulfatase A-like enzyme
VALLCLDSVREDFFREYAPRLQRRADVVYTQCRAVSGWSVPSHASMFTGELPSVHGIHVHNQSFADLSAEDTFLGDMDHHTFGVSANTYASSAFGFDELFNAYTDISPNRRFPKGMDVAQFGKDNDEVGVHKHAAFAREAAAHDHPIASLANGVFDRLDEWLAESSIPKLFDDGANIVLRGLKKGVDRAEEPFFAFANFMDAHSPYYHVYGYDRALHSASSAWSSSGYSTHGVNVADDLGPYEADLRKTRELYGASIDYLDGKIDAFIPELLAETNEETTVVVTADHGENLGLESDGKMVGHRGSMSEGLLHIPLMIVNPPEFGSSSTIEEFVSHLSLPTLLVGLAKGILPDITADHVRAERVGSLMADIVDPDSEEGRYWNRMIRVLYKDGLKREWATAAAPQTLELDSERANWQSPVDHAFDSTAPDTKYFTVPITEYKRRAETKHKSADVDATTRDRLEELGYL